MGVIKLDRNKWICYCDKIVEVSLYTMILFLPFTKAVIEISATFMILAWLLKRILNFKTVPGSKLVKILNPVPSYLNIPLLVYMLAIFLSVIFSGNFSLSFKNFFSKNVEYILLFFIACEFFSEKKRIENTVIVLLVSLFMVGVDCLLQYVFGFDFLRFRHLEAGRLTGCFQMPGDLAGYLGPLFCLSLSLSFLKFKNSQVSRFLRVESLLILAILVASLVRGAWVGVVAAICFLGLLENRRMVYAAIIVLIIAAFILPKVMEVPDSILNRTKSILMLTDASSLDRKIIWRVALQMVRDKPVFGQGLSTFMGNFPRYGQDYFYLKQGIIPYAHNCYLQMAAETGLVGLTSFLILIGTFFIRSIISLRRIKDKFCHAVLSGVTAGIIATLIHSVVDTNLYSLQLSVLFWVMLAINSALQSKSLSCLNSQSG